MTDKELRKLSRAELLELLMEQKKDTLTLEQLEAELERAKYKTSYARMLRSTIQTLIVVAAVAVLIAVLLLPVLRIYGNSMTNTLHDGDIVVSVKGSSFKTGDVIAFYYNNKILVKRVIAHSGDWVNIDAEGNVYVNEQQLEEPYVTEKSLGDCDIELPYQVPDGKVFVMGDHRNISVDSRNTAVGCVSEEEIVGRLEFRVWPIKSIGAVE